ncbi:MAG TPA: tripartite tricarboxylate transporter substrate binding protein [Burkholderiales bacterium]|nr:tripartite tricarboxylate transporter substrate binding protein [Burkholderiales bacterium]
MSGCAGTACRYLALATLALGAAQPAAAQGRSHGYPDKPIHLVVTFPPGGGTDALARLLGKELSPRVGQPVLVENRPGASGNIAAEFVAKSAADGYTLLIINSSFAMNAGLFTKLPFDPVQDFAPVVMLATVPSMIAVHPSVPATNLKELVALAKSKPGKLSFSSCGNGTPQHLGGEMLKRAAKIDIVHIPYKGCGPALADALGGQVPIAINTVANVMPHVKTGRLRAIALVSPRRYGLAPDVPSVAEFGYRGIDVDQWYAILAPAETPADVVAFLNRELAAVVADPSVRERMLAANFEPQTSTPERIGRIIRDDVAHWTKIIKELGVKID